MGARYNILNDGDERSNSNPSAYRHYRSKRPIALSIAAAVIIDIKGEGDRHDYSD
jgi:hypothetical protein